MSKGMDQRYRAVASGYWPLIRYDPVVGADGGNPFLLDSPRPRIALADYTDRELRNPILVNTDPAEAERVLRLAEHEVRQRWASYEEIATRGPSRFPDDARKDQPAGPREANPGAPRDASQIAPQEANPAAPGIAAGIGSHKGQLAAYRRTTDGPIDPLPGPGAAQPAGRVGIPAGEYC
jgi:hypothetical protein